MNVVLLRHGIAVDRDVPQAPADPERWLTDRGVERTRAAVAGLARAGVAPVHLVSSPYVRARQTAELAREALAPEAEVRLSAHFEPGGNPSAAVGFLAALPDADELLCAGHAPQLDRLLAWLVGSPRPFTALKKAGAACLDVVSWQAGGAELLWLLTPRELRALGRGTA